MTDLFDLKQTPFNFESDNMNNVLPPETENGLDIFLDDSIYIQQETEQIVNKTEIVPNDDLFSLTSEQTLTTTIKTENDFHQKLFFNNQSYNHLIELWKHKDYCELMNMAYAIQYLMNQKNDEKQEEEEEDVNNPKK